MNFTDYFSTYMEEDLYIKLIGFIIGTIITLFIIVPCIIRVVRDKDLSKREVYMYIALILVVWPIGLFLYNLKAQQLRRRERPNYFKREEA